jgi:hypothetical protein
MGRVRSKVDERFGRKDMQKREDRMDEPPFFMPS